MSQAFWDPRKILEMPKIYNFFQQTIGADEGRRFFIEHNIVPLNPGRVLEVGCGPGRNCTVFSESTEYVGCDIDKHYIEYANKTYGHRAKFYNTPVGQLRELGLSKFDIIFAMAVLHHISDGEVMTLADEAHDLLNPGGVFITLDPCYTNEQSELERFITSCDRGRHVRFPEGYRKLLERRFSSIRTETHTGKLLVIPYSAVIMFAEKHNE